MPSRGYLWNLSNWITKLGFNRDDQPEIAYSIQPVMVVSDATDLVSPLLGAWGMVGGQITAPAAQFSSFAYRSLAPGGTFLIFFRVGGIAGQGWQYQINDTPVALANEVPLTITDMTSTRIRGVARLGTLAATLPLTNYSTRAASSNQDGAFFLQPGREMLVVSQDATETQRFGLTMKDVPVIPAA